MSPFAGTVDRRFSHDHGPTQNRTRMKTKINHTTWKSVTLAVTAFSFLLTSGIASAGTTITVSLPIDTMDTSVPISTVIAKPVTCTTVLASQQIIGFQGDFVFDSAVIDFDSAGGPVSPTGMTATQWNVSGNVNPGPGPTQARLGFSAYRLSRREPATC